MIKFYLERDGAGTGWRLVSRTERGADLIARSGQRAADDTAALAQLALLAAARIPDVARKADGHWQWLVHRADGTVAAESPAIHRDRVRCHAAFHDARRAAVATVRRFSGHPDEALSRVPDGDLSRNP